MMSLVTSKSSAPPLKTRPVLKAEFQSGPVFRVRKTPLFSSYHLIVFRVIQVKVHGEHIMGARENFP